MPETILTVNFIGKSIFLVLLNTSLQVTLLIPLVWSAIWIFRLRSAVTRYYLWFLAVFGVLALPLFGALLPGINISIVGDDEVIMEPMYMDISSVDEDAVNQADMKAEVATVSEESSSKTVGEADLDMMPWGKPGVNEPRLRELLNFTNIVSLTWFMAASFMLCRLIRSYIWLAHFKRKSQKVEEVPILEVISRLRERMGVTRRIHVFISSEIHSPTSFGLFSTTIILPESLVHNGSDELEMVLSHEMA